MKKIAEGFYTATLNTTLDNAPATLDANLSRTTLPNGRTVWILETRIGGESNGEHYATKREAMADLQAMADAGFVRDARLGICLR